MKIDIDNIQSYRLKQIDTAYYKHYKTDFSQFTTLSKELREQLAKEVDLNFLEHLKTTVSKDEDTIKSLFRTQAGQIIETVLMMHKDGRNTICVSCMQGCPVGCSFCATGQMKYGGRLTADEIVAQVIYFARLLRDDYPKKGEISNVVFMGMGEPMLNFDNVWEAYEILTDPEKFGLGKRKVTFSTSGFINGIEKLISKNYKGRLAISLHAPNQDLRERLMPKVAKSNRLGDLLEVLDRFEKITNKRITYEYIMIDGVTDTDVCARELIEVFKNRLAHFNLIPYNPIPNADFKRPGRSQVERFDNILKSGGIPSSIRVTMGDDIKAACGQLAAEQQYSGTVGQ